MLIHMHHTTRANTRARMRALTHTRMQVATDIGRAVKHLGPAPTAKTAASTSDTQMEVLDDMADKTPVPPAVQELKKLNVCNLNMNLQVTHTLLCENKECGYSRDRRELFRDLSLSVSAPATGAPHDVAG